MGKRYSILGWNNKNEVKSSFLGDGRSNLTVGNFLKKNYHASFPFVLNLL